MDIPASNNSTGPTSTTQRAAVVLTFVATLIGGSAHAVTIPSTPLQSSGNFPAPNILVMLDDSSSMWQMCMPKPCGETWEWKTYVHNSLWYDPKNTYLPWIRADGTRYPYTGGSVWQDPAFPTNPGSDSLAVLTFYMPTTAEAEASKSTDYRDYFQYKIKNISGVDYLIRSRYALGTEYGEGLRFAGCAGPLVTGYAWRDCTAVSLYGRTPQQELVNWYNWYSYHRTRIKLSKAALSEAFSQLGENFRVGFDSLHRVAPGHPLDGQRLDIPVGSDNGLFRGANKTAWFDRLFASAPSAVEARLGTPLRSRLQRAGDYFSWSDPAGPWGPQSRAEQSSCRQNFTALTTDGYWNADSGFQIGDQDATSGPLHQGSPGRQYSYEVTRPYYGNYVEVAGYTSRPNTLADVAMQYWKNDLREDLVNNVPESTSDPAFWQHMVTFGISIGMKGKLDYQTDLPAIINGTKNWGDPFNTPEPDTTDGEDGDHIDDLWHAAVNSHGTFSVASNTQEFTRSLLDSLSTIAARLGSGGNVTANSASLTSDTRIYQASFTSGHWSGELASYEVSSAGTAAEPLWRASSQIPVPANRRILTWNGTTGALFPTDSQLAQLDASSRPGSSASSAENAAYIAGDQSLERHNGGRLRDRSTVLGDIVNSSPMYVRELQTLFLGANDGMLHAFDAATGVENFAYVPSGVDLAVLGTLSDPQYTHKFFVDGSVVVSSSKQTPGRNILVGTLGRGGKGIFALDVTNPTAVDASSVLWEFTDNSNLGQVLGEPLIATLNDANGSKVAIFGNGVNSANGSAVLFVVDLATGVVHREIDTGLGGDNGLMAPRGWDEDGNGTVDVVYAGDLRGRLWKFDFSAANGVVTYGKKLLFTTRDGQPITGGLALAREPAPSGRRWIFAGTGSLMTASDLTDFRIQTVYGLIDGDSEILHRELAPREIAVTTTQGGKLQRAFESAANLPDGKNGWYLDLDGPQPGERVISRPQVRGNVLLFASVIPPEENSCEPGGRGFINAIDVFSGTSLEQPYFDANGDGEVNDADSVAAPDGTSLPVGSVDLGVGMPTMPTLIDDLLTAGGSSASRGRIRVRQVSARPRRISWREIIGS